MGMVVRGCESVRVWGCMCAADRMSHIGDEENNVRDLKNPPELPPCLSHAGEGDSILGDLWSLGAYWSHN